MRTLVILLALLAGCGPTETPPMCDYCKAPRIDAKVYPCRKCQKTHRSCSKEGPLHALEYSKAQKGGDSGGAVGQAIKACPE